MPPKDSRKIYFVNASEKFFRAPLKQYKKNSLLSCVQHFVTHDVENIGTTTRVKNNPRRSFNKDISAFLSDFARQ